MGQGQRWAHDNVKLFHYKTPSQWSCHFYAFILKKIMREDPNLKISDHFQLRKFNISSNLFALSSVLPKYEVTIEMPNFVLVNSDEISGQVCARYTYGKPVQGVMNLTACVTAQYHNRRNRQRPCFFLNATAVSDVRRCYNENSL